MSQPAVTDETTGLYEARCPCGFTVTSSDPQAGYETWYTHECPTEPTRWYDAVFSLWGLVMLFVLGWAVVELAKLAAS